MFAGLTGCTPVGVLNAIVPINTVRHADIPYGSDARQKLDVYRLSPLRSDVAAGSTQPVVVFFYGGGWSSGEKHEYRFVAESIASLGYVVVIPNYRLYPDVSFPAFVEDGAAAVRWTHHHASEYGGDSARMFLMGHSAGAHIASLIALDPKYLRAVGMDRSQISGMVGLAGPYDFIPRKQDRAVFGLPPTDDAPGGENRDYQPIEHVDGKAPPMLLIHGLADDICAPSNSEALAKRITAAGGSADLVEYPGKGHIAVVLGLAWPFRWLVPVRHDVDRWLAEHRPATTQPAPPPTSPPIRPPTAHS
jgi:acetyl esterase/lipase